MSDDLPQFVLARIAEDEEAARKAHAYLVEHAAAFDDPDDPEQRWTWERSWSGFGRSAWTEIEGMPIGTHSLRWSPARVLAECAARRRIVELHDGEDDACLEPGFSSPGNCDTLRLLAQSYADHEGFREEWKVQ